MHYHVPKPFHRKSRDTWYVEVDGRQINLGKDRELAFQRYHAIMACPPEVRPTHAHPGLCIRFPGSHQTRYHFSSFRNGENWVDGVAALEMLNEIQPVAASGLPPAALIFQPPTPVRLAPSTTAQHRDRSDQAAPPLEVMWAALEHLGEDYYTPRGRWLLVGMGLHNCARTAAELQQFFGLWAEWSMRTLATIVLWVLREYATIGLSVPSRSLIPVNRPF